MKKIRLSSRVLHILICLLVSVIAFRQLSNETNQTDQGQNDTLSQSELARLNRYPKVSTQLSSASLDPVISYLQLSDGQTADLPLTSTQRLNQRTDFTVMFWFKVDSIPNAGDIMQIFTIQKTLGCYVDSLPSVSCNSVGIQSLKAVSDQIIVGKWNHLTVSFRASTQSAYLLLQDDNRQLAINQSKDAAIIQSAGLWSACFGNCIQQRAGFQGGVREFIVRTSYILPERAKSLKNEILNYSQDVRAYYRFSPDEQAFFKDQFVSRSFYWRSSSRNQTILDWRGLSMVPQNVCPQSFNYSEMYRFDLAQQIRPYQLTIALKPTGYFYQMSLTFWSNGTSCFASNVQEAVNGCSLVHLEGVFMLYFQSPNVARFIFFASKNYFQTQTSPFFIPNNQWVTIKLFMSHMGGYQVYVLNQNNTILSQFNKQYNMQEQQPKKNLFLFQSLVGYASNFILSDEVIRNPAWNFVSKSPILALDFKAAYSSPAQLQSDIINKGRSKESAQLMFFPKTDIVLDPQFLVYQNDSFDGITCDDGHQVVSLDQKDSYFNFSTPPLNFVNNTQNSSFEFWFKLRNKSAYNETTQIFQIIDRYVDPFEHNQTYWVVYTNNSQLNVAPFGISNQNESAVIIFDEFKLQSEDQYGWWHLACSFQFNISVQCYLSNAILKVSRGYFMVNVVKTFPTYSLHAHFGYYKGLMFAPVNILFKDLRIWKKALSQQQVFTHEQMQIDPSFEEDIQVLLKLNSIKNIFFNLAQLNKFNNIPIYQGEYNKVSQVSDMTKIQFTYYNYQTGLLEVGTKEQSHVVCPTYTYFKEESCYSEPVNQVVLAVFPVWDINEQQLSWNFTIQYSSLLDDQMMQFLQIKWFSNDALLQKQIQQNQVSFLINQSKLRQESTYYLQAVVTNLASTFFMDDFLTFIPNSCQWFEVDDFDSYSAFQQILELPGQSDLAFNLTLRKNTATICQQQSFFNVFQSIDFNYFVSNSQRRIGVKPVASYTFINSTQTDDQNTSNDFKINVFIPASELAQLPAQTNVRILMNIAWSSSDAQAADYQLNRRLVFQNVLYTVNYQTADSSLLTATLQPKLQTIAINQTAVLDASEVITRNIDMQLIIKVFSWQCPSQFNSFCSQQSGSILSLPWQIFSQSGAQYDVYYKFQVTVALVRDGQVFFMSTAQSQIVWYNIVKPVFDLDFRPRPILVSQPQDTFFTVVPKNFDKQNLANFTISWQVFGQLAGRQSITFQNLSQIMMVPSDSWKTNTTYNITCTLTFQKSSTINSTYSYVIPVYGQPFGGLTYISPREGRIGDTFFIYLQGWESYLDTSSIFFTVFSTLDELGNQIGQQLTTRPMKQIETFFFRAQSSFPLVVKISDITGEVTISRVVGFIVDDTTLLANSASIQSQTDGDRLRNLQSKDYQKHSQVTNLDSQICWWPDIIKWQVENLLKRQTDSIQSEVLNLFNQIQNSTCAMTQHEQNKVLLDIFDALYLEASQFQIGQLNFYEILDAIQFLTYSEKSIQVMQRARNIDSSQDYHGKYLRILQQKLTLTTEQNMQIDEVAFSPSQQTALELSQFGSSAYFQLISAQSKPFSLVSVSIFDPDQMSLFSFSSLSGQLKLNFQIKPELFQPNITVCVVVNLDTEVYLQDSCLTQLNQSSLVLQCTCNIMSGSDVITLVNDNTRVKGSPVDFGIRREEQYTSDVSQIKASSYLFLSIVSSISLYGVFGFITALLLERRDRKNIATVLKSGEQLLVELSSKILNKPVALVKLQLRQIKSYMNSEGNTVLNILKAIHPAFSPFLFIDDKRQRSLRFSFYHIQVNLLVIVVILVFNRQYRSGENRFQEVLDLKDIQAVYYTQVAGNMLLVPLIPEQLQNYISHPNRCCHRILLYAITQLINLGLVPFAIYSAHQAPASNQYLIAWAILGSLTGSLVITNMIRVLLNTFKASQPFQYLQSPTAQQVLQDINNMRLVSKMQQIQMKSEEFNAPDQPLSDITTVLNTETAIKTENCLIKNINARSIDHLELQVSPKSFEQSFQVDGLTTNRKLNDAFSE